MTKLELARRMERGARYDAARSDPKHPLHLAAMACARELALNFATPAEAILARFGFTR